MTLWSSIRRLAFGFVEMRRPPPPAHQVGGPDEGCAGAETRLCWVKYSSMLGFHCLGEVFIDKILLAHQVFDDWPKFVFLLFFGCRRNSATSKFISQTLEKNIYKQNVNVDCQLHNY